MVGEVRRWAGLTFTLLYFFIGEKNCVLLYSTLLFYFIFQSTLTFESKVKKKMLTLTFESKVELRITNSYFRELAKILDS